MSSMMTFNTRLTDLHPKRNKLLTAINKVVLMTFYSTLELICHHTSRVTSSNIIDMFKWGKVQRKEINWTIVYDFSTFPQAHIKNYGLFI